MTLNYLGKYDNLSLLWEAHPNGGIEGEYCYVGDQLLVWDKYENNWVEGSAEVLDVIPSDQPERESNNGLNCIGCFESEQQLWSQHPQGGVEGDYVVIAGKEYIWDKYNKEWREATEEDAAHFTAVIVQDEAYEYSRLAITFMGSFEDVSQIWKVYPQGGIEGGYIYLGEDKYIWDKYSYSWKPFEPTESSKLRPIDVTYTEGVVAYSEDYINYIGTFDNLDQVWEMYPNGGKDGDYILVNGERLKWNKYTSNWGEDESGDTSPARSVATIYGDLHVFNDLVIGEGLYARILEELSKKQWVQDNFTTKQWLLDQNYARQEWVLDQYKVLQDWVDQRNADIAKWILERNYISEGDISSETVMNLIETDEITITKKDGVLVAIASGGQGSVHIITTEDVDAIPSDRNVFSAAKAVATFLDTTKGGTVLEPVNFEKGIRIGGKDGIEIIYDIENNALCFGGNAYSFGGITAGGAGSGGSGGGGGESYNRLDSWADYSADKAGYVLSALLGKDLDNRVSALANAGYVTQSALAPYVLRSEVEGQYLSKNGGTVNGSVYMNGYFLLGNSQPIMVADTDGVYQSALYLSAGNNLLIGYGTSVVGKRRTLLFGNTIEFKSNGGEDTTLALNADRTATFSSTVSAQSFIGNLTGTADRASSQAVLYGNRDVNLWDTDSSAARYFALADAAPNTPSGVYALGSILMVYSWDANAGAQLLSHNRGNNIFYRSRWNGAFKDWREIAFTDSNVASATKLQTPRTIWGQSFDGTGNVGGDLYVHQLKIELGNEINSYTYNFNTANGNVHLNYHSSGHVTLANGGGNVAIGGTATEAKLHVYGNGKFTGALTANSLTIGGATITYDSVNEALCINGNMYALGGVTAGGAGISTYSSLEARVARLEQQLNIS